MQPYRSLLFVPAHRTGWVTKALRVGPDAVILDLEDAVPLADKERARDRVDQSLGKPERCTTEEPLLRQVGPDQSAACHFAEDARQSAVGVLPGS